MSRKHLDLQVVPAGLFPPAFPFSLGFMNEVLMTAGRLGA
jgi:hypothetical protein